MTNKNYELDDYFALSQYELSASKKLDYDYFKHHFLEYQDQQIQSACIDKHLGFKVDLIEKDLVQRAKQSKPEGTIESWSYLLHGVQSWVGLNPSQLQTPYYEFIEILDDLNSDALKIIDIGAGYGRLGILTGWHYPNIEFEGIEVVSERVAEGNRIYRKFNLKNSKLICNSILDGIGKADIYFVYDFGRLDEMKKLINHFSLKADANEKFTIIARGSGINSLLIQEKWLDHIDSHYQVSQKYIFS